MGTELKMPLSYLRLVLVNMNKQVMVFVNMNYMRIPRGSAQIFPTQEDDCPKQQQALESLSKWFGFSLILPPCPSTYLDADFQPTPQSSYYPSIVNYL